jgi:hypothetical protein
MYEQTYVPLGDYEEKLGMQYIKVSFLYWTSLAVCGVLISAHPGLVSNLLVYKQAFSLPICMHLFVQKRKRKQLLSADDLHGVADD